jgi:hypothetical protein
MPRMITVRCRPGRRKNQGQLLRRAVPPDRQAARSEQGSVALAHSLSDLIWQMLTTGEIYHDLGDDYYRRRRDPERETRRLVAQLVQLGFHVALTPSQILPPNPNAG